MNPPGRRLYVGRIHPDANRLEVEDLFKQVAPVIEVKLFNGYGFIEYGSVDDAEDAIRKFDGQDFMGDRMLVQFAKNSGRDRRDDRGPPMARGGGRPEQGWRLTISNLPNGVSWQDLKDFARTAGNVHYAEVSRSDPTEGIIEYMSFTDADSALKTLDGVEMRGAIVRLTENAPPAGQTWANPRASPPRTRRDDDDRRGGSYRRDRSRSPGYRRDDRYERRDRDRDDGREPERRRDYDSRDDRRDRDRFDDRAPRRDDDRVPPPRRDDDRPPRRDRSPRYD